MVLLHRRSAMDPSGDAIDHRSSWTTPSYRVPPPGDTRHRVAPSNPTCPPLRADLSSLLMRPAALTSSAPSSSHPATSNLSSSTPFWCHRLYRLEVPPAECSSPRRPVRLLPNAAPVAAAKHMETYGGSKVRKSMMAVRL